MRYARRPPFSLEAYVSRHFPYAGSSEERVVDCPACDRREAHVNVRRGVWVCKRASCAERGSARDFVRLHLGVDGAELSRVMAGEAYASVDEAYDAAAIASRVGGDQPRVTGSLMKEAAALPPLAPPDYRRLPHDSVLGREALAYLLGRGVTADQVATHRIGFFSSGPLAGCLMLPVYAGAEMIYYVARAFARPGRRYLNPPNGSMPRTASEVLFGLDVAELYGRGTLVEGYFDALAESPVGVANFGSSLSESQLALVAAAHRRRPMDWVVKRDGDGSVSRASMFEMARQLADAGARSVRVDVPVGDPGDRLGVASSEPYSFSALIAARCGQ